MGDVLAGPYVDDNKHDRWLKLITPSRQGAEPSCGFDEYDQGKIVDSEDLPMDECSVIEHAGTAPSTSLSEGEASLGLEPAQRERIQLGLRALGLDPGPPDGIFGERTRHAIRLWQVSQSNLATGYLDASSAQALQDAAPEAPPSTEHLHPKCSDLPQGKYVGDKHAECWARIKSRPGCYWLNEHYHSEQSTEKWSGRCHRGVAEGRGTLSVSGESDHTSPYEGTGALAGGKKNGHWTEGWIDGGRYEGEYREGKRNGRGTYTSASGNAQTCEWHDGERVNGTVTTTWNRNITCPSQAPKRVDGVPVDDDSDQYLWEYQKLGGNCRAVRVMA